MSDTSITSEVLGTFGAVFWSIQLIPQIILNSTREERTRGLQPSMMLFWSAAGIPLGIYNILANKAISLQIQPQILTTLSLITWAQVMLYGHQWSRRKAALVVVLLGCIGAGVEAAIIFGLQARYGGRENVPQPLLIVLAALAALGLALGVLRHYVDIWQHRSVRGISFFFVALDAAGDVFSLASVAVVKPLDIEGSVIYALELVLWLGIMACGVVFNLREWLQRRNETESSDTASSVFHTSAISHGTQRLRLRPVSAA